MKSLTSRTLRNIAFLDRVLYAKKTGNEEECASTVLGGEKITVEEACVSIHMFIAKVKLNLKLGLRRSQLQL